jgi:peptidoglycan/xylan/chitin deacetylase (PgdA/CDA1 family)
MKLVSPLLRRVVYPGLSQTGYLRRRLPAAPVTITYHGVLPDGYRPVDSCLDGNLVEADQLRNQIKLLKAHYEIISPDDFRVCCEDDVSLPARSVLLTCDDGLRNHLTSMLPVLQEARVQCLFFVTGVGSARSPAMLWHEQLYRHLLTAGNKVIITLPECGVFRAEGATAKYDLWIMLLDWLSAFGGVERQSLLAEIWRQLGQNDDDLTDENDPASCERFLRLNESELRRLAMAGMTIGAHTDSHPKLSRMRADLARQEMLHNRQQLETILGREVWALAYPFGDAESVSRRDMALAEACGFSCAFMNSEGPYAAHSHRFAFPRIHVTADTGMAELEARISGFDSSLRTAWRGLQERFA